MGRYTGQKYCPSNGTASMVFSDRFCECCRNEKFIHTGESGDKQCDILNRAILYDVEDVNFPSEWQYNLDDQPTCTAWRKWDWNDGDPEESEKIVAGPNQIAMDI